MIGKAITSFSEMIKSADTRAMALYGQSSPLSWFAAERVSAREQWEKFGLPSRKDESWKYTSVNSISDSQLQAAVPPQSAQVEALFKKSRLGGESSSEIVFVNGVYQPSLSKLAKDGAIVLPLSEALKSKDAGLLKSLVDAKAVFGSEAHKGKESSFVALNSSLVTEPVVLFVPANQQIKAPIVVTYIQSGVAGDMLSTVHARVFAIFGRMSSASVIENFVSDDLERTFTNVVTDAWIQDAAQVTYVRLQNEGAKASHIGATRFTLARDAKLESLQLSIGAQLSRQDLKIRLAQAGADAQVDGLYLVRGKQHVDNHTAIEHEVADTLSAQLYKGILDDESRAVFNGRIFIAQDAQRSNSSQLNNNLLLSRKAEVDTKPELEIFADDVKAGHGATIGRLDPEHLFYLQSRAISHDTAVSMLALGFANDVVLRRSNKALQDALTPVIAQAVRGLKTGVL